MNSPHRAVLAPDFSIENCDDYFIRVDQDSYGLFRLSFTDKFYQLKLSSDADLTIAPHNMEYM